MKSLTEFQLLKIRRYDWLGVWFCGKARRYVFRLLNPQFV